MKSMQQLACALLLLMSASAWAAWTFVSGTDSLGGFVLYVDLATIRKVGNTVQMWSLLDFKTDRQGAGVVFRSFQSQQEFDCDGEQSRTLALLFYSGNMGGGDVVHSNASPTKWRPVPPGSVNQGLWNFACKAVNLPIAAS